MGFVFCSSGLLTAPKLSGGLKQLDPSTEEPDVKQFDNQD